MTEAEAATVKLAELLRHPEDLDKIPALKAEFTRKKAAVDGQLRHGLREQLEITQAGMSSISDGQRSVNVIKEEMMKIDKLCAEAQTMIHDFPHINLVSQTHKNFEQVEKMKVDIDTFEQRLENIEYLLAQDDKDPREQPNLLEIHYNLTQLREVRDLAIRQIKSSEDATLELIDNLSLESGVTVQDLFTRLDDVVEWFDKHIGEACILLIELVQNGNDGLVVRLALIIEEEEKSDKKAQALQDAQREYKDLASRFKSIASGSTELRGYKEKFIKSIEYVCKANFDETNEKFLEDPDKVDKAFKWYFNNLNTVKLGMQTLMPKKWKIFRTYGDIYHKHMHDWAVALVEDQSLGAPYLLGIINWVDKYYAKMQKLGFAEEELVPHIVDNRVPELVRQYRQLIIDRIEEWMNNIASTEKRLFSNRDQSELSQNADGYLQTKTLGDMWAMLSQNLAVAASSSRTDVAEGVIDSMFRSLASRQRMWESLVESERTKYAAPNSSLDGSAEFQEWLVAIANDQIICIYDESEEQQTSFLGNFQRDIESLVSETYAKPLETQLEDLKNNYVDLATQCIHIWCQIIFYSDFRDILKTLFTAQWYSERAMEQIVQTFADYLGDYESMVHHSVFDILIDQLADELLIHYLSAVRNKGAKFKRSDPFREKIRDDCVTAFNFFGRYAGGAEIKEKWRVVGKFVDLLDDKANVPYKYEEFKRLCPDLQIGWVEAVLRSRDDFERSTLNAVKAKAAEIPLYGDQQIDTIMGKVK